MLNLLFLRQFTGINIERPCIPFTIEKTNFGLGGVRPILNSQVLVFIYDGGGAQGVCIDTNDAVYLVGQA